MPIDATPHARDPAAPSPHPGFFRDRVNRSRSAWFPPTGPETAAMRAKWMTLPEIALERHITLDAARRLVDGADCPKVFRADGTVYLI